MGVYGVTSRSHSRKHNLHNRTQRRQSSVPAQYMRLKERIARSSAVETPSLANFFGPHLVISPHDRLTPQKSNSLLTRPKATITLSTVTHHNHYDFRIRPYLFSHPSRTADIATLRHIKTGSGSICKSTPRNVTVSRSNISQICVLPASATAVVAATKEDEEEEEEEDETEDVEIDIDGVGRSGYDYNNGGYIGFPLTTIAAAVTRPGNSAAHPSFLHPTTTTAASGQGLLFDHEGFKFGTRSTSTASASTFVFGSESGFESASSSQQVPSLSSSVCSTSSTLSTPPTGLDYSPDTVYPQQQQQQQKDELVKLKREAFQELASQTQRSDDLFIAKMIHWESLSSEEKAQWLERGHSQHEGATMQAGAVPPQHYRHPSAQQYPQDQQWKPREQEQEMDDLVNALECHATVKDYSALIAFEQQAEFQRRSLMEQF
ncbi:hypothetical protein BGX30_001243 [Mortierella sp. GBA39]|nr:hypothetical protein BGX30_001243 [Mortierella sp. GBA39]